MRKSSTMIAATAIAMILANGVAAQPRPYDQAWRPQGQSPQDMGRRDGRPGLGAPDRYYYNGRWVDSGEWQRRSSERDRWARNYGRRRGHRDSDDSSAIVAGIIGFALGAAIVGSAQQAEHARAADKSWDNYCARKYRSYDRRSRTYMGLDGLRRYCQ